MVKVPQVYRAFNDYHGKRDLFFTVSVASLLSVASCCLHHGVVLSSEVQEISHGPTKLTHSSLHGRVERPSESL